MQSMLRVEKLKRLMGSVGGRLVWVLAFVCVMSAAPLHAIPVTVDEILFANGAGVDPGLISGTLEITVTGANQLTVVMRNTSANAAFTDAGAPASMLLTGFGIQLPGLNILSGTATVTAGSTALNFDIGQSLTNISNEWGFSNSTAGFFQDGPTVDTLVSGNACCGLTRFLNADPTSINGPDYGAVSALETQFGTNQPGVRDSITFVLNLSGNVSNATIAAIDGGNVVLAFGSPDTVRGEIPEPSTYALYGLGIAMLIASGWWQKRRNQGVAF